MIKKLILLICLVCIINIPFIQAQEEEFRELTEEERAIFIEYKERLGVLDNQKPPPEDYNAQANQIKADLARKYNLNVNELKKIITNGYLEDLYELYQNWE